MNGRLVNMGEQLASIDQTVQNTYQDIRRSEQNVFEIHATGIEAINGLYRFLHEQREAFEARLASIESPEIGPNYGIIRIF